MVDGFEGVVSDAKPYPRRMPGWQTIAKRFPLTGPAGLEERPDDGTGAKALVWRDEHGRLGGVIAQRPGGAMYVAVAPGFRRRGIGRTLATEAAARWGVNLAVVELNTAGRAWAQRVVPPEHVGVAPPA